MTIRSMGGASHVDLAPTTTAEIIASIQSQAQDDATEASRDLRQLGRALRTEAQHSQIHELRQAAEQEMWSGVMQGVGSIADGLGSIVGGVGGLGREGQTTTARTPEERTHLRDTGKAESEVSSSVGDAANGGLGVASALFRRSAAEARSRATEAENATSTADEVVQSASDDVQTAHRAADRVTEALGEVLREQRRAEDAALRA